MTMTPSIRKLALTAHVTASLGWLGALAVFLAHALASLLSQDEQTVRAASLAMGIAAWFVILPLSLAALVMDGGRIVEENDPEAFFSAPRHERTRAFVGQIQRH